MKLKTILLIAGIILIILAFLITGKSQDRSFYLHWDYYFEYGSSDAIKLKAYEVTVDSVILRVLSDSININWTTHRFTIQDDDKMHFFTMTAVDTAGNESEFSNFGILDLALPVTVRRVYIRR